MSLGKKGSICTTQDGFAILSYSNLQITDKEIGGRGGRVPRN